MGSFKYKHDNGIERLDGEWLVSMCCHATDVRLESALVESSVKMRNGWF